MENDFNTYFLDSLLVPQFRGRVRMKHPVLGEGWAALIWRRSWSSQNRPLFEIIRDLKQLQETTCEHFPTSLATGLAKPIRLDKKSAAWNSAVPDDLAVRMAFGSIMESKLSSSHWSN